STASGTHSGLRENNWKYPPFTYVVGIVPSGSCSTDAFQTIESPASPAPVPAKEPCVWVNAYSWPEIAKVVEVGAAVMLAGRTSAAARMPAVMREESPRLMAPPSGR